jgi:hypothetical protein
MTNDSLGKERELSPAQAEHLRRLYLTFEQAQKQLNDFVQYLLDEHELEQQDGWQLAPDLARFVRGKAEGGGEAGGG